jgi:hypothetical protein
MSLFNGPMLVGIFALVLSGAPAVTFLRRPYVLASYNQKGNPMWEFAGANETVNNWTILLTVVERPDAKTRHDLDRLSQGVMDTYKSRGGRVLMAKTMVDGAGTPYNYMVVAFDEPAKKRFELNFVKAAMGAKNAYMTIYGVRVTDPKDYVARSKAFLSEHSGEIRKELEKAASPVMGSLPRREF